MRAFVIKFNLISDQRIPFTPLVLSAFFYLYLTLQMRFRCSWRHYANKLVYGWRFSQNQDAAFASFGRIPRGGESYLYGGCKPSP
jgi:hypothetical protein